jgi:hypothetical protein
MANTTRSSARTPARFGRAGTGPSARPFARQAAGTSPGRFARRETSASRPRRTPARATSRTASPWSRSSGRTSSPPWIRSSRTQSPFGRVSGRKSKRTGLAGTIAGMLPAGAAAKAAPTSKKGKAGGLLALAAAAGVAFRNRDKLTAMVGRDRDSQPREEPVAGSADTTTSVPGPSGTAGSVPGHEGGAPNAQQREL